MNFIRDLHFFIHLIVLFLVVLYRVDAECIKDVDVVEEIFYQTLTNEFNTSSSLIALEILTRQDTILKDYHRGISQAIFKYYQILSDQIKTFYPRLVSQIKEFNEVPLCADIKMILNGINMNYRSGQPIPKIKRNTLNLLRDILVINTEQELFAEIEAKAMAQDEANENELLDFTFEAFVYDTLKIYQLEGIQLEDIQLANDMRKKLFIRSEEGSSSSGNTEQKPTLNELCNKLLRSCGVNDIQTTDKFEDLKKFYFYGITSNTGKIYPDDYFVSMFKYQPLLPCFSEGVEIFFMKFINDRNEYIYLFRKSSQGDSVEPFAVFTGDTTEKN